MASAGETLDEILRRLEAMPADKRKVVEASVVDKLNRVWLANPGPQTAAFLSEADEIFYGGQAGGGKTDLAVGLALTAHKRSLILRRFKGDAVKIVARVEDILGHRDGFNGQANRWRLQDRLIEFNGCEQEADKQRFKGDPHDLIVFDEGTDFLESQYRFIKGWNRSADPKQRCRVLVTSNPPTTADGLWVIQYWAPWLDDTHPNPAKPGELRWFTTIGGKDVEVDGRGPHLVPGEPRPVEARSRTFIPASLDDNPDLAATPYGSVLAALPDELRQAYRDGNFNVGLRDVEWQVIPTAWIIAAQDRWTPSPPDGVAMTAIGADVAGGGADTVELAPRHHGWYAPLTTISGPETKDANLVAKTIIGIRRDRCPIVMDMGGGYGGAPALRLEDNGIVVTPFNGANSSSARTEDGSNLSFANKRAKVHWRFREALDPNQQGGSIMALPPDPEVRSDLAAPTWKLGPNGILIEPKEAIKLRLGRSPNKGDAVIMAWSEGQAALVDRLRPMPAMANRGHASMKPSADGMPARANRGRRK